MQKNAKRRKIGQKSGKKCTKNVKKKCDKNAQKQKSCRGMGEENDLKTCMKCAQSMQNVCFTKKKWNMKYVQKYAKIRATNVLGISSYILKPSRERFMGHSPTITTQCSEWNSEKESKTKQKQSKPRWKKRFLKQVEQGRFAIGHGSNESSWQVVRMSAIKIMIQTQTNDDAQPLQCDNKLTATHRPKWGRKGG